METTLDRATEAAHEWWRRYNWPFGSWGIQTTPAQGQFPDILRSLEPLIYTEGPLKPFQSCPTEQRWLLVGSDSPWVACFGNTAGIGGVGILSVVGRQLACRVLLVQCIPRYPVSRRRSAGRYSRLTFDLYSPEAPGPAHILKQVGVDCEEGRWEFWEGFSTQPFEERERYEERHIWDRFTPDMLERYCRALGIRIFDDGFYGPEGAVVGLRPGRRPKGYTFEEARAKLGIA